MRKILWTLATFVTVVLGLTIGTLAYQDPPTLPIPYQVNLLPQNSSTVEASRNNSPNVQQQGNHRPNNYVGNNSAYFPPSNNNSFQNSSVEARASNLRPGLSSSDRASPFPGTFHPGSKRQYTLTDGKGGFETVELDGPLPHEQIQKLNDAQSQHQEAIRVFKDPKGEEAKQIEARATIKKYLESIFDFDQSKRRKQVEELESRMADLKGQIEKREKAKDRLIEMRITLLEDEREGLGFPNEFSTLSTSIPLPVGGFNINEYGPSPYQTNPQGGWTPDFPGGWIPNTNPPVILGNTQFAQLLARPNTPMEAQTLRSNNQGGFAEELPTFPTFPKEYQGHWKVVEITRDGQPVPSTDETSYEFVVSKNSIDVFSVIPASPTGQLSLDEIRVLKARYRLNDPSFGGMLPSTEFMANLVQENSPSANSIECPMQLDNDKLTIANLEFPLASDSNENDQAKMGTVEYKLVREPATAKQLQ